MKVERIVKPTVFPVSEDLVYSALNLSVGTDSDLVNTYIEAATHQAERDTDRAFVNQTWRITLDYFPCTKDNTIYIPKGTSVSISKFEYVDSNEVVQSLNEGIDYTFTKTGTTGRIRPIKNWPNTYDGKNEVVVIDVVVGEGCDNTEMPGWIKTAVLLLVQKNYDGCADNSMAYESIIASNRVVFDYKINDRHYGMLYGRYQSP